MRVPHSSAFFAEGWEAKMTGVPLSSAQFRSEGTVQDTLANWLNVLPDPVHEFIYGSMDRGEFRFAGSVENQ